MGKPKRQLFELSLRPYNGRLFIARTPDVYEKAHRRIYREDDPLTCDQLGRFTAGVCPDDRVWTYLVWAKNTPAMAHELSHVVLHTFKRCGIDPCEAKGEPFCYLLSQLMLDAL